MAIADAIQIFKWGVAAVQPATLMPENLAIREDAVVVCGQALPLHEIKNIYVIGAGKAAAAMSVATESILKTRISDGVVVTKYGHSLPCSRIKILEGAHPVPDNNCVEAVQQTLELLQKATPDDLIICLISGGASALWCDVPPGAPLKEVQQTFDLLLKSGADIQEVNTVRKHLSGIKGGQLVRHCGGARVCSLIISDVPGDDPDVIASGPTVADASTFIQAYSVVLKYGLLSLLPQSIIRHLEKGAAGSIAETPKKGDALFCHTTNKIIGNNQTALLAAGQKANALGYHTHVIAEQATGDAEAAAKKLVQFAFAYNGPKPACILQGGETTVQVSGAGKGGRNQHFALAALQALEQIPYKTFAGNITLLSAGTDGTDGPTDAAGGVVNAQTLLTAQQKGLSVSQYLNNHDAYHFLAHTNSLLVTGPTQTNVMDLMIAIIT